MLFVVLLDLQQGLTVIKSKLVSHHVAICRSWGVKFFVLESGGGDDGTLWRCDPGGGGLATAKRHLEYECKSPRIDCRLEVVKIQ